MFVKIKLKYLKIPMPVKTKLRTFYRILGVPSLNDVYDYTFLIRFRLFVSANNVAGIS